jgi:hypothetical protein
VTTNIGGEIKDNLPLTKQISVLENSVVTIFKSEPII